MSKVVVIGWDGATFDLIEPLIKAGKMPHLEKLIKKGVHGRLNSSIPPLTPIAWTSISTGVNPGKHGIVDAFIYSEDTRKLSFVNATLRKVQPVWTILSNNMKSVGIFNVPVTYPPEEVDGFVISGMFTPEGAQDAIYPSALEKEIESEFGRYQIECRRHSNPYKYLKILIAEEIEKKTEQARYLMNKKKPDFFFTVFLATDRAQHFFWKYKDVTHPENGQLGDAISTVYENMDRSLGKIVADVPQDSYVMMVSDHGAERLESSFFLNSWLIQNGYIKLFKDPASVFTKSPIEKINNFLQRVARKILPATVIGKMSTKGEITDEVNAFLSIIDWEKTSVFSEGVAGGIFINRDVVKPEERDSLLARLTSELLEIRDPKGKTVIEAVHRREEIYSGEYVDLAPDLTVICNRGFQIIAPNELLYFNKSFENGYFLEHSWSGRHEQNGIFILSGPGIKENDVIEHCDVEDITPTILHLMECEVPENMDGDVLREALRDDHLQAQPVRYTSTDTKLAKDRVKLTAEEQSKIAKRLSDLGYLQ